jgi:hypothetical protein
MMKKRPKVLLLIETSRQYGRGLLKGITKYAFLHGPWIIEQETPFYIYTNKTVRLGIDPTTWNIDGVIMRDKKFAKKVIDYNIPVIFAKYFLDAPKGSPPRYCCRAHPLPSKKVPDHSLLTFLEQQIVPRVCRGRISSLFMCS